MWKLPISSDAPHFSQEHFIGGRRYVVEFEWIEREEYWVMHLFDDQEEAIALGLKVMLNWPIFVDQDTGLAFLLIGKTRDTQLTKDSLQTDFFLVACEFV